MGTRFGVNRIRFYPRNTVQKSPGTPFDSDFLRAYESFTNDGVDLTAGGNQVWVPLNFVSDNKQSIIDIPVDPPRYVRSIRLKSLTQFDFEIDEIEVYGRGYSPEATYLSNIFDAGEPVTWIDLSWLEEVVGDPDFSGLQIRTRTGTDDSPFRFTRKLRGKPGADELFSSLDDSTRDMTRAEYERLPQFDAQGREFEPGSVQDDLVNWSPFSTPFEAAAANGPSSSIVSPSPRRYFQFQVEFQSKDIDAARILRSLNFKFSQPIADAIVGEIFPREGEPSTSLSFIYALRSSIRTPGVLAPIWRPPGRASSRAMPRPWSPAKSCPFRCLSTPNRWIISASRPTPLRPMAIRSTTRRISISWSSKSAPHARPRCAFST